MLTLRASSRTRPSKFHLSLSLITSFFILSSAIAFAAEIKLAWDPNTEADLAGYKIYYGTSARTGTDPKSCASCGYSTIVPIGNVTTQTIGNLVSGQTYYFSVTAYDTSNNESGFSNEVGGAATDSTETVSIPTTPSGPSSGLTGTGYSYSTGGSVSSLSHSVEYQFDWKGDGTDLSPWGTSNQSKTWGFAGNYLVRARARCATDTTVVSNWSAGLSVGMSQPAGAQPYTVSTNSSGLQVSVDDSMYTAPQTFQWVPGSSHKLYAPSPQSVSQGSRRIFSSWSDGGTETHTINAPSSGASYNAYYKGQNKLKITVTPTDAGTVSMSSKNKTSASASIALSKKEDWYDDNDTVTLVATANPGYSFSGWTGDLSGKSNSASLSMAGPKDVVANFTVASETVSTPNPPSGPVKGNPGTSYSYSTGGATSSLGDSVEYQFDWKGDGTDLSSWGSSAQSKIWAEAGTYQVKVRARCKTHPDIVSGWSYALSVAMGQTGTSYTVATNPSGLPVTVDGTAYNTPQTFSWSPGSSHTLSVSSPQPGASGTRYIYASWSDGGEQTHTITTPSSGTTCTASFTAEYVLTTSANPAGGGTVNPSGTGWLKSGQNISVTATENTGFRFSGWSGDLSGTTNPASLVMTGPKNITANFTAVATNLVVTPSTGLSASGPAGGPFTPSTQNYTLGNMGGVTINWSASKTQNWVSLSSSSGSLSPGESTTVTVSINSGANALGSGFYGDTITFNNLTNGNGTATRSVGLSIGSVNQGYTVTTDPPGLFVVVDGLNYRSPETFNWTAGSLHTVSISSPQYGPAGSQYAFNSWNDGGGQSHTLTAPSSGTIYVASFLTQYSLTAFVNPSGGGQVNPPGLSWYNGGESVPVSALVNSGYSFSSWSGDLSGTSNPTSVLMNGPKIITANYSPNPCSVTVNVSPPGMGTVTKDPDKSIYGYGEQVTFTARANDGYNFKNWSGDLSGEANPITVVIKGDMIVTANLVPTGSLEANPAEGLSASGRQGGTFTLSNAIYTLRNRGAIPVKWKVSKKPRWVSLSLTNGSLAPGETAQIEVSIGSSAAQLKMGSYSDKIVFSNASNGNDSLSRSATIRVNPAIKTYTVKTKPEGLQVIVDGVTYPSSQTFEWEVGSSHALDVPSPQTSSPGTQSVFSSWSNRKSQNQTITAPSSGTTYTANFKVQYVLTTLVTPPEGGIVTPSGMTWVNQGQRVSVTARSNGGYQFVNWSGDFSSSRSPAGFTLGGPMTLVANFAKIGTQGANEANAPASMKSFSANMPMVGALESPSEGKRVMGQKTIYGWALDEEGISKVKLLIDGEYVCDIPYGGLREDLKQSYPDYPNVEKGGFALIWNYSALTPGVHVVQVDIQNMKGEVLRLSANVMVHKFSADMITQVNPNEWLIPGVNLTVDGNTKTYDLKVEWSNESQAFELIDLSSP